MVKGHTFGHNLRIPKLISTNSLKYPAGCNDEVLTLMDSSKLPLPWLRGALCDSALVLVGTDGNKAWKRIPSHEDEAAARR